MFQHFLRDLSVRLVAEQYYVSPSIVERLVHRYKGTGDVRSVQEKHGPDTNSVNKKSFATLLDKPGIFLREVQ